MCITSPVRVDNTVYAYASHQTRLESILSHGIVECVPTKFTLSWLRILPMPSSRQLDRHRFICKETRTETVYFGHELSPYRLTVNRTDIQYADA